MTQKVPTQEAITLVAQDVANLKISGVNSKAQIETAALDSMADNGLVNNRDNMKAVMSEAQTIYQTWLEDQKTS